MLSSRWPLIAFERYTNTHIRSNKIQILSFLAAMLAFTVIILGAYTRLKAAGLGCPDWPGCYGHWTVPSNTQHVAQAMEKFPGSHIEPSKAWPEMIHRYVAGTLGLFILAITILSIQQRQRYRGNLRISLGLIALVLLQAALGRWTVTWLLLPTIVLSHLLGGLSLLCLLWWLYLKNTFALTSYQRPSMLHKIAILGLILVFLQIALGGWTSTNYAGLICPDFPTCQGQWLVSMHFSQAFQFLQPIGLNYEGGLLDNTARVTIQVSHRLGAVIVFVYWSCISLLVLTRQYTTDLVRLSAGIVLFLLCLQISLGILNIVKLLPLPLALAHNAVAALLLLATLSFVYFSKFPSTRNLS